MPNPSFPGADLLTPYRTPVFSGRAQYPSPPMATALPYAVQQSPITWIADQPGTKTVVLAEPKSNSERAFDQLVTLKLATANYSMHLQNAWRTGLFKQLDRLLDEDEWDFSDEMPSEGSFKTFLRLIIHNQVKLMPGIGATSDGKIIAAWTSGKDRLTVECLADDTVRWVLATYENGRRISSASTGPVSALRKYLAPAKPEKWFG